MTLTLGNCIDVMKGLPAESVSACVTDPPYGLEFMGKDWDGADGFRRSRNPADVGRESLFGRASRTSPEYRAGTALQTFTQAWGTDLLRVLKPGAHALVFGGSRTHHRLMCGLEEAGFEIRDVLMWLYGSGFPKSLNLPGGWGTALKPAYEAIILARKPLCGTVAANVQAHGTGAMNIDACRTEYQDDADRASATPQGACTAKSGALAGGTQHDGARTEFARPELLGRWPANVLHDGLPEEWSRYFYCAKASRSEREAGCEGLPARSGAEAVERDEDSLGTRSPRAGAGRTATTVRNFHPTVKPVALMRWLCRLVTPPGAAVFDPFCGSGSTGVAALAEGLGFHGIDQSQEYLNIAAARLKENT